MRELHVYALSERCPRSTIVTYSDALDAILRRRWRVDTTQTHFVQERYIQMGYDIYVHRRGRVYKIVRGMADETRKQLEEEIDNG